MSRPVSRAGVALSAVALLAGCGAAAAHHAPAATAVTPTAVTPPAAAPVANPSGCTTRVDRAELGIARRIYAEAASGANVRGAKRRLARSSALARAVAAGNRAAASAALRPLLRAQIHRIRISRGRRMLVDYGHSAALAPAHGVITLGGRPVGRYVMAVATQAAVVGETRTVTGTDVAAGPSGAVHDPAALSATAYPSGPLRIALRIPAALTTSLCRPTDTATRAAVVSDVAQRLFASEAGGPQTQRVLRHVALDRQFRTAVAQDDPATLRAAIVRFFRTPSLHVVRIRAVTANGTLVNDVGGPYVLAPASRPVRDASGRVVGEVTLSVQDDTGYMKLVHRFTGAHVVLRGALGVVPGSALTTAAAGVRPDDSFTVAAFPTGSLQVDLYARATG
jgi:hypothetical protein